MRAIKASVSTRSAAALGYAHAGGLPRADGSRERGLRRASSGAHVPDTRFGISISWVVATPSPRARVKASLRPWSMVRTASVIPCSFRCPEQSKRDVAEGQSRLSGKRTGDDPPARPRTGPIGVVRTVMERARAIPRQGIGRNSGHRALGQPATRGRLASASRIARGSRDGALSGLPVRSLEGCRQTVSGITDVPGHCAMAPGVCGVRDRLGWRDLPGHRGRDMLRCGASERAAIAARSAG